MTSEASSALRELRDTLRTPVSDLETFTFLLSSTLRSLGLASSSVAVVSPSQVVQDARGAVERYLPVIQHSLVTLHLPTFLHALDPRDRSLVDTFFCPAQYDPTAAARRLRQSIASISYRSLPQYFSVSGQSSTGSNAQLPPQSRHFLLEAVSTLSERYSLRDLYDAIWDTSDEEAEGSKEDGLRRLRWEETVRASLGLPSKVANSVGRWKAAGGWDGEIPSSLRARAYYDRCIVEFEHLMFDLCPKSPPHPAERLQLVLQRFGSLGLIQPPSTSTSPSAPSLFPALLPPLLHHIAPFPKDGKLAYPAGYLPGIILGLPTALLNSFTDSLISHLSYHLIAPDIPLAPDKPDDRIGLASTILTRIIGPAKVGGEAWDAVVRSALSSSSERPCSDRAAAKIRLITAWIAESAEKGIKAFIDAIVSSWSDPKNIKFHLYSPQFHLTHLVISLLSRLQPYSAFLRDLAFRPQFLSACQTYLAHPDGSVRRLGMLVAEVVSQLSTPEDPDAKGDLEYDMDQETEELMKGLDIGPDGDKERIQRPAKRAKRGGTRLKFGSSLWDGQGEGKEEARWLRSRVGVVDPADLTGGDAARHDWTLGWGMGRAVGQGPEEPQKPHKTPSTRAREGQPSNRPLGQSSSASRRKQPKIVMLDDPAHTADPLRGYAPTSPSSSRSASPTQEYYDEIAADPSLALDAAQKKKILRPVYMGQLLQLLKEKDNPDATEMAMKHGEALIRAKRGFGREVAENAVNLVGYLVGMHDQYGLEGFEEKRQAMVTALAACAPREVAPMEGGRADKRRFLAIQYFINQYSLQQKSVMLTALAMAARELAGIQPPPISSAGRTIDFPSKTLPPALHRQYASIADVPLGLNVRPGGQLEDAAEGLRGLLLGKGAQKAAEVLPDVAREKSLRVGTTTRRNGSMAIAEVGSLRDRQLAQASAAAVKKASEPVVAFRDVAAEFFIMPLINHFWQHFQDAHAREKAATVTGNRFRGAGAGLILSPLALEKFLMTLALLVHAARYSPVFLAVLAPEALELGMTIGTQHFSRPDDFHLDDTIGVHDGSNAEAQVLGAALELALVTLDTSFELDAGRTLATDKPQLVLACAEWAHGVFETEEKGGKVAHGQGGRGGREGRIRGSAAGVVVKTGEIGEKWAHLMGGRR